MSMPAVPPPHIVRHRAYGTGRVLGTAANGQVRVYFELLSGIEVVRVEDLDVISGAPEPTKAAPGASRGPVQADGVAARLALECLRQGLPPPGTLLEWTFGQSAARSAVATALKSATQGKGSVLSVVASNGQGKSHLGRVAREMAQEKRFAVFSTDLDGTSRSFADGVGLLDALFGSAQLPSNAADQDHRVEGLTPILRRAAAAAGRRERTLDNFAPFLVDTRWWDSEEACGVVEEFLCGKLSKTHAVSRLYALGVYMSFDALGLNAGRIEDRRNAQVAHLGAAVHLSSRAGASGCLIVIDEFDHDMADFRNWHRKYLLLAAVAESCVRLPVVLLLLTTQRFAWLDKFLPGFSEVPLSPFSDEDLRKMVIMAIDAFARVHPLTSLAIGRKEFTSAIVAQFRSEYERTGWGPRYVIRAAIEGCEVMRRLGLPSLSQVPVT